MKLDYKKYTGCPEGGLPNKSMFQLASTVATYANMAVVCMGMCNCLIFLWPYISPQ